MIAVSMPKQTVLSIYAFPLQHFPLTHTFTHNPKYILESKDWWRRRNTQRCTLTRRKAKLLFAHFITKSGLIIITGVWELPYNL